MSGNIISSVLDEAIPSYVSSFLSLIMQVVYVETEIAAIGGEIASLEETLVQERRLRENKDAYDAIARDILKYPPRADLQRYRGGSWW